jgi:hypothetical protein
LVESPELVAAIVDTNTVVRGGSTDATLAADLGCSLERLAQAWRRHIAETEAQDGLLNEIVEHAPRLCAAVEELRQEHQAVAEELRALRLRLVTEYGPSRPTLDEVAALLAMMKNHDQTGASLIWEAYSYDLTGGE